MGIDHIEERVLLDLSRVQRMALAERWPLILLAAGEPELAEEIRAELCAADHIEFVMRAA